MQIISCKCPLLSNLFGTFLIVFTFPTTVKVCKWLFAALVTLGLFVILPHTKAPGVKGSSFNRVKVTVILMRINIPYVQLFITCWPNRVRNLTELE